MPTFYFDHNMRKEFNAPQFTRTRHKFRGPRESEKINLEINQLYYSMHNISKLQKDFQDDFTKKALTLLEGGEVEGVENADNNTVAVMGLEQSAKRISIMKRRVEALEA